MDKSGTGTTGQGGTTPTNNTGVNAEDDWVLDPTLFLVSFAKARIFFDLKQKSSYANAILRRLDEFYIWAKLNDLCHLVPQQTEHESIAQIIGAYYDGNIEFKRKIEQGFQAIGIKKPKADGVMDEKYIRYTMLRKLCDNWEKDGRCVYIHKHFGKVIFKIRVCYYSGEWMDEIACLGEIYGDLYGKGIKGCEMEQTANDPKDKKSKQEAMAKRYEALNRITDANRGKKRKLIQEKIQDTNMYFYQYKEPHLFSMHHDRHLHEAFHEGIKCIMQHVTPDGTFQNLCMTPSFLLSRDDVRIQVPHTDYVVTEPIEQMPWSFSLPLTDAGMQLNCWGVESDGQPFPRNATRIITSKNEALLWRGDFIHGGGLPGKKNKGPAFRMHLYLEYILTMHIKSNQTIQVRHSNPKLGDYYLTSCLDENGNVISEECILKKTKKPKKL